MAVQPLCAPAQRLTQCLPEGRVEGDFSHRIVQLHIRMMTMHLCYAVKIRITWRIRFQNFDLIYFETFFPPTLYGFFDCNFWNHTFLLTFPLWIIIPPGRASPHP